MGPNYPKLARNVKTINHSLKDKAWATAILCGKPQVFICSVNFSDRSRGSPTSSNHLSSPEWIACLVEDTKKTCVEVKVKGLFDEFKRILVALLSQVKNEERNKGLGKTYQVSYSVSNAILAGPTLNCQVGFGSQDFGILPKSFIDKVETKPEEGTQRKRQGVQAKTVHRSRRKNLNRTNHPSNRRRLCPGLTLFFLFPYKIYSK